MSQVVGRHLVRVWPSELWVHSLMQTECPLSTSLEAQVIHAGIRTQTLQAYCLHSRNYTNLVPWEMPPGYFWASPGKPHMWSSRSSTSCCPHWAFAGTSWLTWATAAGTEFSLSGCHQHTRRRPASPEAVSTAQAPTGLCILSALMLVHMRACF